MKIGIIGLPSVGKSTIFHLLTGGDDGPKEYGKAAMRLANVPDERIDWLSELYQPKKTVYANVEFLDVDGLTKGVAGGNQFLNDIRDADALIHVVRLYEGDIPHVEGSIDPVRDIETVNMELLFSDLDLVEKRIERIDTAKKKVKGADVESERAALVKYKAALEKEQLASTVELTDAEAEAVRSLRFLTEKPQIIVVNTPEAGTAEYPFAEEIQAYCAEKALPLIDLSAQIEGEIAELPKEDQQIFMEDLGITETGIYKLARKIYELLGLMSFFTVGPDEVRAWTIERGTVARKAAGKIHSDIERGFIRAEIFTYDDIRRLGTAAKVKEAGLFRLEGKEYIMQDGDIVNFRFNV